MHSSGTRGDLASSNIVALGKGGPYQLTIRHAHGAIVEYFQTTKDALRRQAELEDLLAAAQGFSRVASLMEAR